MAAHQVWELIWQVAVLELLWSIRRHVKKMGQSSIELTAYTWGPPAPGPTKTISDIVEAHTAAAKKKGPGAN